MPLFDQFEQSLRFSQERQCRKQSQERESLERFGDFYKLLLTPSHCSRFWQRLWPPLQEQKDLLRVCLRRILLAPLLFQKAEYPTGLRAGVILEKELQLQHQTRHS